jgi:hypothetical protein
MTSAITFLSRKEKNVHFRTAAHNFLVKHDDQYDIRFQATMYCREQLEGLYKDVMISLLKPVTKLLLDSFHSEHDLKIVAIMSGKTIFLFCTKRFDIRFVSEMVGFSYADRSSYFKYFQSLFDSLSLTADIAALSAESPMSLLEACRAGLEQKVVGKAAENNKRPRMSDEPSSSLAQSSSRIESIIGAYYDENPNLCNSHKPLVVLFLEGVERLVPSWLSVAIDALANIRSARFLLILDCCNSCAVPISIGGASNRAFHLELCCTPSTTDFYDTFIVALLSAPVVPVFLPPPFMKFIQKRFIHEDRCLKTLVNRISLVLTVHFSNRKALLSLIFEQNLMTELKIIKTSHKSTLKRKTLDAFMPYISAADLLGTGLEYDNADEIIQKIDCAMCSLYAFRIAIRIVHACVRKLLHYADVAKYDIVDMWSEIVAKNEIVSGSVISELFLSLKLNINSFPLKLILSVLHECKSILDVERFIDAYAIDKSMACFENINLFIREYSRLLERCEIIFNELLALGVTDEDSIKSVPDSADCSAILCAENKHLSLRVLLSCAIEDSLNTLAGIVEHAMKHDKPENIDGIFIVSDATTASVIELCKESLRSQLFEDLSHPDRHLSGCSETVVPDVCTLYDCLKTLGRTGNVSALFEAFCQFSTKWNNKLSTKKRKYNNGLERSGINSRFLSALNDIQRCGIIKITNNGKSFHKTVSAWVYGNSSNL